MNLKASLITFPYNILFNGFTLLKLLDFRKEFSKKSHTQSSQVFSENGLRKYTQNRLNIYTVNVDK